MPVLTMASQAMCPHGGQALLLTTNTALFADGSPVLLESDIHVVIGCPFFAGPAYSPCVTVQWVSTEESLTVAKTRVLTATSIGKCLNAAQVPQGLAIVTAPAAVLEAV
jgi:hypothetical protein